MQTMITPQVDDAVQEVPEAIREPAQQEADMYSPPMTADEFEVFADRPENADRLLELNYGTVREKMPTLAHGFMNTRIALLLGKYLEVNPIGELVSEVRHQLPDDDHNAKLPDISFTLNARLTPILERGAVPQMPDLAIEIQSPDDSIREMREKAAYYLANGSQRVWLFFVKARTIEVHQNGAPILVLTGEMKVEGGDLLPGFSVSVNESYKGLRLE